MLTIANLREKSKYVARRITRDDIFLTLVIVLVGLSGFGLGRIERAKEATPQMTIYELFSETSATVDALKDNSAASALVPQTGSFVASKNGTKYHLPWCGSAQRIKEENKVWFATREEAEGAGYTPASNCPGL